MSKRDGHPIDNISDVSSVGQRRYLADRAVEPDISAIENLLHALEGMQTQMQALTDLVIEQDKRIRRLEKAKSKIIQVAH